MGREAPFPIVFQDADIEMDGRWATCKEPNRVPNGKMSFHDCCPKCLEQAEVFMKIDPKSFKNIYNHLEKRLKLYGKAEGAI